MGSFKNAFGMVFLSIVLIICAFLYSSSAGGKEAVKTKTQTGVSLSEGNSLSMSHVFKPHTVAAIMAKAQVMNDKLAPGKPIYLILDTPGGSVFAGLELIDYLNSLQRPVHTVTIFSASMGFHTSQGLGKRYIVNGGTMMSHKASGGFRGEFPGQLDSRYKYILDRINMMDGHVVSRTNGKYSLKSYQALIENEYWCNSYECVRDGFADEVARVSCDESLSGTRKEVVNRMVLQNTSMDSDKEFKVVELALIYSKCPTITGPLGMNIFIDNKPLFSSSF
jgi:ATP-dependent Clp protease protease subunit